VSTCSLPTLTTKRKHASHQLLTCTCVLLWTHLFLCNNNSHPINVGCSYVSNTQSMPRLSAQPVPSRHSVCYMFGHMSCLYHCAIPAFCPHRWSKFGCQYTCLSWKAILLLLLLSLLSLSLYYVIIIIIIIIIACYIACFCACLTAHLPCRHCQRSSPQPGARSDLPPGHCFCLGTGHQSQATCRSAAA